MEHDFFKSAVLDYLSPVLQKMEQPAAQSNNLKWDSVESKRNVQ